MIYDTLENKIKCPKCGNDEVWKVGRPRRKQPYKCKACKRKFITKLNYSKEFKQKAIAIYEWNSGRAVDRMVEINKSTVRNWRKLDKKQKVQPAHRIRCRKSLNQWMPLKWMNFLPTPRRKVKFDEFKQRFPHLKSAVGLTSFLSYL